MSSPAWQWLRIPELDRTQRSTRTPLTIYVLWHAEFSEGAALGREVAEWFGGVGTDARTVGLGIPVYFRSADWGPDNVLDPADVPPPGPEGDDLDAIRERRIARRRRPIELNHATHNVFVPLVDDHMVDDPSWRRDLLEIATKHHAARDPQGELKADAPEPLVHLLPFQLTAAWPRMPEEVTRVKALYLRRWSDDPEVPSEHREALWRDRFRRLLTQALVRLLREAAVRRSAHRSVLPTEVFLSHAKADLKLGPGVAEQLRDVAAGYGQIEVFYDENDLPAAGDWLGGIERAALQGAGFIAVLSDRYATRFWCRREVQLARTPRRVSDDDPAGVHTWAVSASVVAVTMDGTWTRLVSDLATVPAIRWRSEDDEQAPAILDQLFREALVSEFQILYAQRLYERLAAVLGGREAPPVAFVTWTPDAASLLRLSRQAPWGDRRDGLVVYPGHGFLPTEEVDLQGSLGPGVAFTSYEQLADALAELAPGPVAWADVLRAIAAGPAQVPMAEARVVALSAGDADDLSALGYDDAKPGSLHLDVAVLRLSRAILQAGVRIAYGGILRPGGDFTSVLQDMAIALFEAPSTPTPDPITPLDAYVAAPYRDRFRLERRAQLVGLCRFYFVGEDVPSGADDFERARVTGEALTAMRRVEAARTRLTIAMAGKRWGFSGFMPGVAEEVLCAMEADGPLPRDDEALRERVRVVLLGEFGGITREMARFILSAVDELPPSLTLEGQEAHGGAGLAAALSGSPGLREALAARYADLHRCLEALRSVARMPDDASLPRLGLTVGQWKQILAASSVGFVRRLLRNGLVNALP